MPDKPGIYLRGGTRASFDDEANAIGDREVVMATDTGEIGTKAGWINPAKLAGKVKNIYYAETPAERQDIYSQTPQIINGLSLTITPETENSSFIVVASISSTYTHVASLLIYKDDVSIHSHGNNTNQSGAIMTMYEGTNRTDMISSATIQGKIDTTGTNPITIDIRGTSSWGSSVYHMYINDRASNDMRGVSSMTVYEIERTQ